MIIVVTHLSRLALMFDHYYSSKKEVTQEWQNPNYEVYQILKMTN